MCISDKKKEKPTKFVSISNQIQVLFEKLSIRQIKHKDIVYIRFLEILEFKNFKLFVHFHCFSFSNHHYFLLILFIKTFSKVNNFIQSRLNRQNNNCSMTTRLTSQLKKI